VRKVAVNRRLLFLKCVCWFTKALKLALNPKLIKVESAVVLLETLGCIRGLKFA
jgi:hypothetical protein